MNVNSYIDKAKNGDQVSFTFLLDYFWNDVYGFMLKRIENEKDTEDITIETFSKAFDKIATFNIKYQFNTWLIAIAKNVHIDMIRKKKSNRFNDINVKVNFQAYNVPDNPFLEDDEIILNQKLSKLMLYLKRLKPHYQEVIQLRYFNGMSYQEIAEHLNQPLNNIKIKLLRAKKLLSEIIDINNDF